MNSQSFDIKMSENLDKNVKIDSKIENLTLPAFVQQATTAINSRLNSIF